MRRIFTILIVLFVVFLLVLVADLALQTYVVANFIARVIGPTAVAAITGAYNWVISTIGVAGFAGIVLIFGFFSGIIAHVFGHKADWKLRRWGASRTASDLGTTPISNVPATPTYATVRPEEKLPIPIELAPKEEPPKAEESTT